MSLFCTWMGAGAFPRYDFSPAADSWIVGVVPGAVTVHRRRSSGDPDTDDDFDIVFKRSVSVRCGVAREMRSEWSDSTQRRLCWEEGG